MSRRRQRFILDSGRVSIAHTSFIVFVVRMELLSRVNHFAVYRMWFTFVYLHDTSLVARNAYYNTLTDFTRITFFTHAIQTFLVEP